MKRRLLTSLVTTSVLFTALPAAAEMGLEPGAPQAGNLPGGVSPGVQSQSKDDWRFDFHGYFSMPLWMGFGQRCDSDDQACKDALPEGQGNTTVHAPPVVPGENGSFADTNILPDPWTQLNFSYGTSMVRATVIVAASTASSASGYFNPPDHIGIQDAFITLNLGDEGESIYRVHAGAFSSRYGTMGEYDEGEYATPVTARVEGAGLLGTGRWALAPHIHLMAEAAVVGNIDKPVLGTNPEGWNGFADANTGSTFGSHAHVGVDFNSFANVGLHLLHTFAKDDQANVQDQPDANMTILGLDGRFTMGPAGHLFVGGSHAIANNVASLGSVVHYLNTKNGPDLIRNYLGAESGGTGTMTTIGLQYDFSLASALLAPEPFSGNAPDLKASVFGMMTMTSQGPDIVRVPPINRAGICSDSCLKFGGEVTYKPFSMFAAGVRVDQVAQNLGTNGGLGGRESFTILSPRLIFSSDWNSQDQITLQYSYYAYGSEVAARNPGYDPRDMTYSAADHHTLLLNANMWW